MRCGVRAARSRTRGGFRFIRVVEVFVTFLRLGLTSFGGPVAHIGYFREEFVSRRAWLSEAAFADLVAPCHMIPGPASSQGGLAVGSARAGFAGALAAWLAFTLPSAVLLAALCRPVWTSAVHGAQDLVLVLVASAALAVWKLPAWRVVIMGALASGVLGRG